MKLPKILEDEQPLKNDYFASITSKSLKKYKTEKLIFDWQSAQVKLISRIPDEQEILQQLIQFQNQCKAQNIPHFYSYFFVERLLIDCPASSKNSKIQKQKKSQMIQRIKSEMQELKNKKSKWNKIIQLIQLRQNLVSKIDQQITNNKLETVYQYLDDIRFINFQITKKISEWSQTNKSNSQIFPFFLYQGNNYLVKMINDNIHVLNLLNSKAVKFLSPPNPFYLSRDGNKASMSQTQQSQIDNCMEILAKQKAQQLRMMINPPDFVSQAKNEQAELKKLKNQLQNEKAEKIRSIYKSNSFANSSINLRSSAYSTNKNRQINQSQKLQKPYAPSLQKLKKQKQISNTTQKRNNFEKLIQQKQIAVVQDLKNSQVKLNINKPTKKKIQDKTGSNKYLSKVQSLRKSVEQNNAKPNINNNNIKLQSLKAQNQNGQNKAENIMRLSMISNKSTKNQLPKTVADIKAPKPKIKLVMQKQTFVEDVIKQFLPPPNMQLYKSLNVRKTSHSFFKPTQKQQTIKQQNNIDIKPITQYSRTLSASNLTQSNFLKGHSKTKNKFQKSKRENKSKSISNKSNLSLSKSPVKKVITQKQVDNEVKQPVINDNSEANLRVVNSKLRELTIMSIYGKKNKSINSVYNPYETTSSKVIKKDQKKINEKNLIDEQLIAVKNRLKDLSITKIYDRKNSTQTKFDKKKQIKDQTINLVDKQKQIKDQNKQNQQKIKIKLKQKEDLLTMMKQKDKRIEQLLIKLKKQQPQNEIKNTIEQQKLKQQKIQKTKQIQQLKQKIKSQNKLIKQQMQEQQKKFIALKQKQFEMKQQEMMNKYRVDMQQMKQQYIKKNKQLQAKIIEQQKIRKLNQIKLLQQQRQMQELRMQMEEKKLKQQLLEQVLRQHQEKQIKEATVQEQNQQLEKERVKKQLLQFQQMQRKMLQNYQQDNRRLHQMFDSIKRKNEQTQKQNQRKLLLIKQMQQQTKAQQQRLKRLQEQLIEARKVLQQQQDNQLLKVQQNEKLKIQQTKQLSMQQIKLKVKQQILKQMISKKKQQQNKQQIQKKQRAKKLAQIQQQIRNQLKRQQIQMQKIQKQQRQRFQRIKIQLQQQHRKKMQELSKNNNEQYKNTTNGQQIKMIDENQKQKYEKNMQENHINKQEYQIQLKKAIEQANKNYQKQKQIINQIQNQKEDRQNKSQKKQQTKQQNNMQIKQQKIKQNKLQKIQQNYSLQVKQKIKQQKKQQQNKQQKKQQIKVQNNLKQKEEKYIKTQLNKQDKISVNIKSQKQQNKKDKIQQKNQQKPVTQVTTQVQKKIQNVDKKNISQQKTQTKQIQQPAKNKQIEQKTQIKKQTQTIKQPSQQLLTKYQNLQQHLTKCKQLYMDDKALPQFLSNFYSAFAPQVKQMLPYTQDEILKFVSSLQKKIDIYECSNGHSIGWMDEDKYILLGQVSCVESIVRKYGQTQIQMTYIFNKTNPYQKQFLAKQVKIFDKVGFIFQKKLKQDNMFSIKLIIKVPIQIIPKNFKPPNNQLRIKSKVGIQMTKKLQNRVQNNKYSYSYLLSQTLKNCLSAQQQLQFKEQKLQQSRLIYTKMHYKLYNDTKFKSEDIDDKKMKIQANLNLKYMQTHQYPCYVIKGGQYINSNSSSNQKIYVSPVSKNLSIVIFYYDKSCEGLSVDVLLTIKTAKLQKQRQLIICFPVWKKQEDLKLTTPGPKQFNFSYSVESNLIFGSIINTNVLKQEYKLIEGSFVFSLFQTNDNGLLLRPLVGQLVELKDQVQQKR